MSVMRDALSSKMEFNAQSCRELNTQHLRGCRASKFLGPDPELYRSHENHSELNRYFWTSPEDTKSGFYSVLCVSYVLGKPCHLRMPWWAIWRIRMLTYLSRDYELNYWTAVESPESSGAEALRTQTSGLRMQEELCSCARAATADQFSLKTFNLETQQWLWTDEPVASWQPWLCLALCLQVGLSQGKAQPMRLALALYRPRNARCSWNICIPPLSLETPSGKTWSLIPPNSQISWLLNAKSANTVPWVESAGHLGWVRIARFQGWFSKGRQAFSI